MLFPFMKKSISYNPESKTLNPDSILIVETAENLPPLMVMQKRSEINQIRERKTWEVNQVIQEQH